MIRYVLVFCLIFTIFLPVVFASSENTETATIEANTQKKLENTEEYTLPYPGILPDNPLYPIKAFRDRIVGFLISDTIKKTEFNILQADKRLQSGVLLFDNKKYKLAIDTISKAENYLEEARNKLIESKKQGKDVVNLKNKLQKSTGKHSEIIAALAKKSPKEHNPGFSILKKRISEIHKNVEVISP